MNELSWKHQYIITLTEYIHAHICGVTLVHQLHAASAQLILSNGNN